MMEKYRGKTLEEWKEYIKKDNQVGIRTAKYIVVLEEIVEEMNQQLFCKHELESLGTRAVKCIKCKKLFETE
jgi:uncharacterized protein (UPF0147 family)